MDRRPACTLIAPSFVLSAVLLALSAATARSQSNTLSNLDFYPCCIAPDGHGNNFIVSAPKPTINSQPAPVSVVKVDSSGNVVSEFSIPVNAYGGPNVAAVDPQGNLWLAGFGVFLASDEYPPIVSLIVKLDSTGGNVLFTSNFGGVTPGSTGISAIGFDPDGNLYVGGATNQPDFPVTPGAFMTQFGTATAPPGFQYDGTATYGYIAKLTPASQPTRPYTLAYATLLGGDQLSPLPPCPSYETCGLNPTTGVSALAVDATGVVTAAGTTDAVDFPVTPGTFQTQYQGQPADANVFVTRLNAQGSGLIWSTLLGVASPTGGNSIVVSGLAVDSTGNLVLTGTTNEPGIPVTAGAIQPQFSNLEGVQYPPANGFVAKLNSTGSRLLFSTYYGSDNNLSAPRLDAQGDIWITGSVLYPSTVVLHPNSLDLGGSLIAELAPDGSSVLFSELLSNGVAGRDLVLNPDGSLTAAGPPLYAGSSPSSGFLLRLPRGTPAGVSILGVADSAVNEVTSAIAPGEYLSIYGTGLGPAAGVGMQIGASGLVADSLGGTQVFFDGIPAPLLYAVDGQVNVLVPYGIAASSQVNLQIATNAGASQTGPLQVVPVQPNVIAVLNSDGSTNSVLNPAAPGTTVSILVSGAGVLNRSLPDGTIAGSPAPLPALPVQVDFAYSCSLGFAVRKIPCFGNQAVTPSYAGAIPGAVVNLLRVDAQVPAPSFPGAYGFSIAIRVGSWQSPSFPLYLVTGH